IPRRPPCPSAETSRRSASGAPRRTAAPRPPRGTALLPPREPVVPSPRISTCSSVAEPRVHGGHALLVVDRVRPVLLGGHPLPGRVRKEMEAAGGGVECRVEDPTDLPLEL